MNFFITGCTGFIGHALCQELIRRGHFLRLAVRSSNKETKEVQQVLVKAIEGDVDWTGKMDGMDVVIHLAARVHVMRDKTDNPLEEFLRVNFYGTSNLARKAAAAGVKRFVYVSSIKVNGEYTDPRPFNEMDQPNPQDPYGISKWRAEQALHAIAQETGMEVVIVRPPLVYGPGVKANFARLLKTVDKAILLPLANIRNFRSMIYVGNLVDALITCAVHPKAAGQTYLVSDGEDVSTSQLIRYVAKALDKPDRIFAVPMGLMRGTAKFLGKSAAIDRLTQSLVIDSSRIREDLDWKPPYTLEQGLKATAKWYRESMGCK